MAKNQFRLPRVEIPIQATVGDAVYDGVCWDDGPDVYARLNQTMASKYAERRRSQTEVMGRRLLFELVTEHLARQRQRAAKAPVARAAKKAKKAKKAARKRR